MTIFEVIPLSKNFYSGCVIIIFLTQIFLAYKKDEIILGLQSLCVNETKFLMEMDDTAFVQ